VCPEVETVVVAQTGGMQLVAVMFTDLVDSTPLYSQLGPRRAAALRERHFESLTDLAEAHGGHVVKKLGDGVMAVFGAVTAALHAATAMQRAAYASEVSLKIGISAGDAQLEDGDWHGRSVIEASRICAVASGGEILVAESALVLAPEGQHQSRPRGPAELKGLPSCQLHEALWNPSDDAPLRLVVGDDAALLRAGLVRLLDATPGIEVVGHAGDGTSLLAEVRYHRPDLVIADMRMPPEGPRAGLAVLEAVRRDHPGIAVVLLSARVEPDVAADLAESGVRGVGYLHKERVGDVPDFISALRAVAAGACVLDRDTADPDS
jgi:CheY-like chemotaxis protein